MTTASQELLEQTRQKAHPNCHLCGNRADAPFSLDFQVLTDGSVLAEFIPPATNTGYPDLVHGGTTASVLDAAMTNCLFSQGIVALTARLTIRYVRPFKLGVRAQVRAESTGQRRGVYSLMAEVQQEGQRIATAEAVFCEHTQCLAGEDVSS
jgi:uncharacterized protein (TIGR00369 family)